MTKRHGETWFPPPEEVELRQARKEAAEARAFADQVITDVREEMHWLEIALKYRNQLMPSPETMVNDSEVLQ